MSAVSHFEARSINIGAYGQFRQGDDHHHQYGDTGTSTAKVSVASKIWKVPRASSPFYTGRKELGKRLNQAFALDSSTISSQQRIFVIVRLGGTGKSEICLKFAEEHRKDYWGVFWLDARNIQTATDGYIEFGQDCGVPEPNFANVKSFLANQRQRWLLVIDNADDLEVDYSSYIPSTRTGDVLLTTRCPECCINQTVGCVKLDGLEPELARELLLKASSVPPSRWKDKESAAMDIVKVLDRHTLAMVQASAFIRQRLCTLEEYPAIFQQQQDKIMRFNSKEKVSTYGNVYATFEVSARYLKNSTASAASDALNLIHVLAFLHNGEVSEALFERASEHVSKLESVTNHGDSVMSLNRSHIDRIPDYMQRPWSTSLQDRLRWREACAVLESLSIIKMCDQVEPVAFSIHTLVHIWAKERQDFRNRCKAWRMAATIIALSCQGWYSYHPFFPVLRPHVQSMVQHELESYTADETDLETAQIVFQWAHVLMTMRDDDALKVLVKRICCRLQGGDGTTPVADSAITLQLKYLRGLFFKEILSHLALKVEEDDPDRLALEHLLANAYLADGRSLQAIDLLEHVVRVEEKLADDHPDRLASQHALANAYRADGQILQAIQLLEHVDRVRKKLAEDDPDRLASQHALADAYLADGRSFQAIDLLEHVVRVEEKLADDHPDRLASRRALADARSLLGPHDLYGGY